MIYHHILLHLHHLYLSTHTQCVYISIDRTKWLIESINNSSSSRLLVHCRVFFIRSSSQWHPPIHSWAADKVSVVVRWVFVHDISCADDRRSQIKEYLYLEYYTVRIPVRQSDDSPSNRRMSFKAPWVTCVYRSTRRTIKAMHSRPQPSHGINYICN